MMVFAPLALTAATAALVAIPLAPAVLEFRRRQDAAPLPTRTDDGHIENFAQTFATRMAALEPAMAECRAAQSTRLVRMADGSRVLILADPNAIGELAVLGRRNDITAVIFCGESTRLAEGVQAPTDVYCATLE